MMAQAAATETAVVEMTAEAAKAEAETAAAAAAAMTAETAEVTAPATAQQYNQRVSADKSAPP